MDSSLTTVFHSIFALERVPAGGAHLVRVALQVPGQGRKFVKELEENLLNSFLSNVATSREEDEGASLCLRDEYGVVSYTLFNSQRFEGFWRSSADGSRFIVGFSSLPLYSAARQIFEALDECCRSDGAQLLPSLHSLCEAPVLPACGVCYQLRFPSPSGPHQQQQGQGLVALQFSANEQLDDHDVFSVALQCLTPRMLVLAWESLVLERHVLVVSSAASLIAPCCEFLRRLLLPLPFVNSFVPHLPDPNLVDAPVPYLHGISAQRLRYTIRKIQRLLVY